MGEAVQRKELSPRHLATWTATVERTVPTAVGSGDWLGIRSIIIIKTVTRNRLTATTRARLQIATNLMKRTAPHSTVITLRMLQIICSTAVWHAVKLLTVDDKLRRILCWLLVAMPTRLFGIP